VPRAVSSAVAGPPEHGHGKYQLSILFIGARNSKGKCSESKPPVAFQQIIRAQGPVHL